MLFLKAYEPPKTGNRNNLDQLVVALLGETKKDATYRAAMVMLAPMECDSWTIESFTKLTGFTEKFVTKCVMNLRRYGIFQNDTWCCHWGELFLGMDHYEKMTDDEVFKHQISFTIDALVGEGRLIRHKWNEQLKDWSYQRVKER